MKRINCADLTRTFFYIIVVFAVRPASIIQHNCQRSLSVRLRAIITKDLID